MPQRKRDPPASPRVLRPVLSEPCMAGREITGACLRQTKHGRFVCPPLSRLKSNEVEDQARGLTSPWQCRRGEDRLLWIGIHRGCIRERMQQLEQYRSLPTEYQKTCMLDYRTGGCGASDVQCEPKAECASVPQLSLPSPYSEHSGPHEATDTTATASGTGPAKLTRSSRRPALEENREPASVGNLETQ